jgi:hypothetical protein
MQTQIAGMAWYQPGTFLRLRAMFEDGHKLHKSYDEWLVAAELGCKTLEAKGIRVVRVDIDPDKFPEWCKSQGLKLNADARTKFANIYAAQMVRGAH